MSSIGGAQQNIRTLSQLNTPATAGPPPRTGVLSTQFNAQFGSPTGPGLGMLNLIMFG
jgi:hypothetical protein